VFKLQKKPTAPKREHPALQNIIFLNFFSIFVGHICPPESGYGSTDLINPDPDPDPEHCCQYHTLLVPVFIFPLLGLLELVELGFLGLGQILPDLLVPTFIT
jgi:hypothetical protein